MSPRPAIDHIRKPQILRAAAEVITERGLTATRIADVAERAGTSGPAVLYWFGSREELLSAALIADERAFAEQLDARLAELPNAGARLREIIDASFADGDLSLWIELWARSLHDPESRAARRRLDEAWRARIASVIAEGVESAEFDTRADPGDVAVALASLIDALAVQVTLEDPEVTVERAIAICVEYAEFGLVAKLTAEFPVEELAA